MDEFWWRSDSADKENSDTQDDFFNNRKKSLNNYNQTGKVTDLFTGGLAGSALSYVPKTAFSGMVFDDQDAISQNLVQGGMDQNQAFTLGEMGRSGLFGDKNNADSWSKWFGDKGNQAMIGAGLGVGQLGLGLASYLQQSDFMKKQGKLLDQQLASNQYEMDRRRGFSNALAAAMGSAPTRNGPDNNDQA